MLTSGIGLYRVAAGGSRDNLGGHIGRRLGELLIGDDTIEQP